VHVVDAIAELARELGRVEKLRRELARVDLERVEDRPEPLRDLVVTAPVCVDSVPLRRRLVRCPTTPVRHMEIAH